VGDLRSEAAPAAPEPAAAAAPPTTVVRIVPDKTRYHEGTPFIEQEPSLRQRTATPR
jgi:hypothetical protein